MPNTKNVKTRPLYVLYFGSEENADFPNDQAYQDCLARFAQMRPEDIQALPMTIIGDKTMRLRMERLPYAAGDQLVVERTKSSKSPAEPENDKFVKRARVQFELFGEGKVGFVLAPYYARLRLLSAS